MEGEAIVSSITITAGIMIPSSAKVAPATITTTTTMPVIHVVLVVLVLAVTLAAVAAVAGLENVVRIFSSDQYIVQHMIIYGTNFH